MFHLTVAVLTFAVFMMILAMGVHAIVTLFTFWFIPFTPFPYGHAVLFCITASVLIHYADYKNPPDDEEDD